MKRRQFLSSLKRKRNIIDESSVEDYGYEIISPIRGITEIRNLIKFADENNGVICGGYPLYCCNRNPDPAIDYRPGDVDIYCLDEKNFNSFKKNFISIFGNSMKHPKESQYSWTFESIQNEYIQGDRHVGVEKIQLIKPVRDVHKHTTGDDIFEILNNFDITVCQTAILDENKILISKNGFQDMLTRSIRLVHAKNPYITFSRVLKYASKGFKVNPDTMDMIFNSYNTRDSRERETGMSLLDEFVISGANS